MNVAIVTLLFTDLVGSSELLDRLGDDEADALRRTHFRLLREAVSGYGGEEVKNLGDGLMVAFPSAMDAISCAIAMQQAVTHHNEDHRDMPIVVRIGLHAGEPVQEDNDYFGRAVVIASRICDKAGGGQIIASELVENIVGGRGGFTFRDIGSLDLKGIASPVPAREIVWDQKTSLPPPVLAADVLDRSKARAAQPELVGFARAPRGVRVALALLALILAVVAGAILSGKGYLFGDDEPSAAPTGGTLLEWNRVQGESAGFAEERVQRIHRIATNDSELVAVGFDTLLGNSDAAVWRSSDGEEWTRDRSDSLGGRGGQLMWGVTYAADRVVAVGYDGAGADLDAAVWIDDGTGWEQVESDELGGPDQQVMNRVAFGPFGLVAGGYSTESGTEDGALWISEDGTDWARVDDPEIFGGPGDQEIRSVAMNDSVIVVVGSDSEDGRTTDEDAAVWVSSDGVEWQRVPGAEYDFGGPQDQVMTAIEASEERGFVAVGWDEIRTRDAAVWTSDDGFVWARSSFNLDVLGGEGDQEMFGVDSFGDRFVAVGSDDVGGGADAAVWTSGDGKTWQRLPADEDSLGGDLSQQMRWVIGFRDRLIGAGWDELSPTDSNAVVWWAEVRSQT